VAPASISSEDDRAVREGFDVLQSAGKLGAMLLQFPFSFHRNAETTAYLEGLLKRFAEELGEGVVTRIDVRVRPEKSPRN